MLEMIQTVRKNAPDSVMVVAGAEAYAYDADSLISLDKLAKDDLLMWNFHPYMG